jgi:hypothetical protein
MVEKKCSPHSEQKEERKIGRSHRKIHTPFRTMLPITYFLQLGPPPNNPFNINSSID